MKSSLNAIHNFFESGKRFFQSREEEISSQLNQNHSTSSSSGSNSTSSYNSTHGRRIELIKSYLSESELFLSNFYRDRIQLLEDQVQFCLREQRARERERERGELTTNNNSNSNNNNENNNSNWISVRRNFLEVSSEFKAFLEMKLIPFITTTMEVNNNSSNNNPNNSDSNNSNSQNNQEMLNGITLWTSKIEKNLKNLDAICSQEVPSIWQKQPHPN